MYLKTIKSHLNRASNSFRGAPKGYGSLKRSEDQIVEPENVKSPLVFKELVKYILYWISSMVLSTMLIYLIIHSQSIVGIGDAINLMISASIGFAISIGFTFSYSFRAIMCLSLPQISSMQGRIVILSIITGMLIGGPLANLLLNANEFSKSIQCTKYIIENKTTAQPLESSENTPEHNYNKSEHEFAKFHTKFQMRRVTALSKTINTTLKSKVYTQNLRINSTLNDLGKNISHKLQDIRGDFKKFIFYSKEILRYSFFITILILPWGSYRFLKKFRENPKSYKKPGKMNLIVNLGILGFHILLALLVIGFDWLFFWLLSIPILPQLNSKNNSLITVQGDIFTILEISGSLQLNQTRNSSFAQHFDLKFEDFSECVPKPNDPRGLSTNLPIFALYIVVLAFTFIGRYSNIIKYKMVKKFFPKI